MRRAREDGGTLSATLSVRGGAPLLRMVSSLRLLVLSGGVLTVSDRRCGDAAPPIQTIRLADCRRVVSDERKGRLTIVDGDGTAEDQMPLDAEEDISHASSNPTERGGRSVLTIWFGTAAGNLAHMREWKDALVKAIQCRIGTYYKMLRSSDDRNLIGKGHYARVVRAVDRETGQVVAVKIVKKRDPSKDSAAALHVQREAAIAQAVEHPNVVRCLDVFETGDRLHIVMELATGGTLADLIERHKPMDEDMARSVLKQVLRAVAYLHDCRIAHRDIKPENVLLSGTGILKLGDFGLSRSLEALTHEEFPLSSVLGTPSFVAPEIARRRSYGLPVDMWSVGVILHVSLTGKFPFSAKTPEGVFHMLRHAQKIPFPRSRWACVSPAARDLVRSLLTFDPTMRLTAHEALAHPWIGGASTLDFARTSSIVSTSAVSTDEDSFSQRSHCAVLRSARHGHTISRVQSTSGVVPEDSIRRRDSALCYARATPSISNVTSTPNDLSIASSASRLGHTPGPAVRERPGLCRPASVRMSLEPSRAGRVTSSLGFSHASGQGHSGCSSVASADTTAYYRPGSVRRNGATPALHCHETSQRRSYQRTPSRNLRSLANYRNSARDVCV